MNPKLQIDFAFWNIMVIERLQKSAQIYKGRDIVNQQGLPSPLYILGLTIDKLEARIKA